MKLLTDKVKYVYLKNSRLYGLNTIDKEKLNDNSEFRIGSITKLFTVVVLLRLQEQHVINLQHSVNTYLSSGNAELDSVSIMDLIRHTSGMKRNHSRNFKLKKFTNTEEVYNTISDTPLITLPKGKFSYSNLGYIILGSIIESVTNSHYYDVYHKYILKPLKMHSTDIGQTNIKLYNKFKKEITKQEKLETYYACSAGALHSTIADMKKFATFPSLLTKQSLSILKTCYFYRKNSIKHSGVIPGGNALLEVEYNDKWNVQSVYVKLKTVANSLK